MANIELIMPKMGESIIEATILEWLKQPGDTIELDENVLLIATDKVDTEVPSPVSGTLVEIMYPKDSTVGVGQAIAVIATEQDAEVEPSPSILSPASVTATAPVVSHTKTNRNGHLPLAKIDRFYSPLVKNIAKTENIALDELESIPGSGLEGRVTKSDVLNYLKNRTEDTQVATQAVKTQLSQASSSNGQPYRSEPVNHNGNVEIIEMDRMRRLIADHMVRSKHTSPHVTSFIEADVTNMVNWRNSVKAKFQSQYGQKITFTPIIIEAVVKAIRDFPMINVSVDGNNIIVHKDINVGMAAALPSGNLIVPVIRNADEKNLIGLTKSVNDLANRARANQLKPQEIQGGTFTLTNVGTFGNVMGTPIINQPQVAILAAGAIRKKPAVIATEYGDVIAIRQQMFLSLSYDHRVVDGFLGGSFLRRVGDYLEQFDHKQSI